MAIEATALYRQFGRLLRITPKEARGLGESAHMTITPKQSMRIDQLRYPSVVISASGMATGGRVLHHLKVMAPDPRHHIVFPGFQVGGSRGAYMVAGAEQIKIHGEYVPVRARVSQIRGFSGHADADGVLAWLRHLRKAPHHTFVVHGEPEASDTLRLRIKDELGWRVRVPQHGETVSA
jgi:metallo-beta-lactamase family protein